MQGVLDAETVLAQIQEQAERIKSDETQYFPVAASPGDCWRQGDIYITLLPSLDNIHVVVEQYFRRQLVPGSTKGSRHCLDSLDGVTIYRLAEWDMLAGPIIECTKQRTITHPEHGDIVLPPGIYAISFQQSLDSRGQAGRVLD